MTANILTTLRLILLIPFCVLVLALPTEAGRWAALAVFLGAGLTDILDGYLARKLGQASRLGATLDLIADRLLTAVSLGALIAADVIIGWAIVAGMLLIGRDLVVASLNEALPGHVIRATSVEPVKIGLHFLAVSLLIAPPALFARQHEIGAAVLGVAALMAAGTLVHYVRQALVGFAAERKPAV